MTSHRLAGQSPGLGHNHSPDLSAKLAQLVHRSVNSVSLQRKRALNNPRQVEAALPHKLHQQGQVPERVIRAADDLGLLGQQHAVGVYLERLRGDTNHNCPAKDA